MKARLILAMAVIAMTSGCAATQVAISKRNLDVETKMSSTVFLNPVPPAEQTVYVQIRNTSDKDINIANAVKAAIASNGYRVVNDPRRAHYMLQADILSVGKMDPSAAQHALLAGYGGALEGAAAGVAVANATNNNSNQGMGGFGLLGAIAGTIANAAVKDVTYTMITDLQISERARKGVRVDQQTNTNMSQGTSTRVTQHSQSISHWKRYRTRIVSTAEKVNLAFADAKPTLEHGLIRSISGVF